SRPQVAALLKFLPAATTPLGTTVPVTVNGVTSRIPVGSLTSSTGTPTNNWQWSSRVDQNLGKHTLGGRYLYNDNFADGNGQVTPPGLTTQVVQRQQAASAFLTSNFSARTLNEGRISFQRLGSTTNASDHSSEAIPSIEINELGLVGFNAAASRT